ncbi:CCA tRNA nucleotidyltransferase [Paracoccus zeaxanthinifaciens]|uniref:CCA tRNA nucleotidyltransferase n=1 Tax=Paracoccus zeaxanthinifaciens TaxID=187400 RepID=UPI0003B58E6B|nr:CCA tRNA nucleotidyltransferase [Paracoccus zeaxanthinifaciens]
MTRMPARIMDDPDLRRVLGVLTRDGARAWLVGGAVRNALLDQPVDDIDIATDALPQRVMAMAADAGLRAVPTGIDHGTVTLVAGGKGYEITTLRRDVETDGRHAVVSFSDDLAEDAARRDFTMNALYAGPDGAVLDPMGGLPDLAARRLRFVGDPERRIAEDYLRILRFFRFLAWYGDDADPQAVDACAALAGGLDRIARERIGAEMRKLLAAPDPRASVALMARTGVLAHLLPDADADALADLVATEIALEEPPRWPRRLAALGTDAADALRLSKAEARHQQALRAAADWSLDEAGYRMDPDAARDHAVLTAARGMPLPPEWRAQLERARSARLPIAAADLAPLRGPAIGRGLRAAEAAWIASGFVLPAPALIDTAIAAAEETA